MSRALFLLGYVWALPVTLFGLLVAVGGWCRLLTLRSGALVFAAKPGGPCDWFFRRFGFGAFAWGGVVVLASEGLLENDRMLSHELRHFQQARWFGPLMPLAYGACALWELAHGRQAYRDNWFEVDARRAA
jgi:hypothetical protein